MCNANNYVIKYGRFSAPASSRKYFIYNIIFSEKQLTNRPPLPEAAADGKNSAPQRSSPSVLFTFAEPSAQKLQ